MTRILVFSGKMQAGKDSAARFLVANGDRLFCWSLLSLPGGATVDMPPVVGAYALMDRIKAFLVECLGLRKEQVWGSNADKNSLTHLLWEKLPGYGGQHRGPMTGREVMEQMVEGVLRPFDPDVVIRSCLGLIEQESPEVAVVTDLRRREELWAFKQAGARIIRLTRTTREALANTHITNLDLDADRFDWKHFDAVIHNQELTLEQTHRKLYNLLVRWGWVRDARVPGNSAVDLSTIQWVT